MRTIAAHIRNHVPFWASLATGVAVALEQEDPAWVAAGLVGLFIQAFTSPAEKVGRPW